MNWKPLEHQHHREVKKQNIKYKSTVLTVKHGGSIVI